MIQHGINFFAGAEHHNSHSRSEQKPTHKMNLLLLEFITSKKYTFSPPKFPSANTQSDFIVVPTVQSKRCGPGKLYLSYHQRDLNATRPLLPAQQNLHGIWLKNILPVPTTALNLFSAAGVGQDTPRCNQPSTRNLRAHSKREGGGGDGPGGGNGYLGVVSVCFHVAKYITS